MNAGVVKRLIEVWLGKIAGFQSIFSATTKEILDNRFSKLHDYYPCEFQRAPRGFKWLTYWRAHEYRQFILYVVYAVMHDFLSEDQLSHVLTLQVIIFFLFIKKKKLNYSKFIHSPNSNRALSSSERKRLVVKDFFLRL